MSNDNGQLIKIFVYTKKTVKRRRCVDKRSYCYKWPYVTQLILLKGVVLERGIG